MKKFLIAMIAALLGLTFLVQEDHNQHYQHKKSDESDSLSLYNFKKEMPH